jgi:outer membrane protein
LVTLTNTQRQLIAQLDEYYHEARVATDQVDSLHTSVDTARESLRLTRLRYSNGEATALEVVDAQSALALAEAALADGILRSHVARANLQTLTGTL